MVQKEVGERILAPPGSRQSGIMTVFLQSYLAVKKVTTLKSGSFRPKPKVDSVVLIFAPVDRENAPGDHRGFLLFLKSAFSQRRKKLANALKKVPGIPETAELERISGIDLGQRPEELRLAEWFALFAAAAGGRQEGLAACSPARHPRRIRPARWLRPIRLSSDGSLQNGRSNTLRQRVITASVRV